MIPNTTKMVELLGKPPRTLRDSDGDGVPDIIDCKPHNKNKQGFVHDIKEKWKKRSEERAEVRTEERKAYQDTKMEQAKRVGKERAKIEADKKIKRYKEQKPFGQAFMSGFGKVGRRYVTLPIAGSVTPRKKGKKKGKKGKRRAATQAPRPTPQPMVDINRPIFKW